MSIIEENINLVVSELIDDLEKEDTYEQNAFNHPDNVYGKIEMQKKGSKSA